MCHVDNLNGAPAESFRVRIKKTIYKIIIERLNIDRFLFSYTELFYCFICLCSTYWNTRYEIFFLCLYYVNCVC